MPRPIAAIVSEFINWLDANTAFSDWDEEVRVVVISKLMNMLSENNK